MKIFESLMACRFFGLDVESVKAYNMIHITFADDETVCGKWEGYYRVLCIENLSKAQLAEMEEKQTELLRAIASSLGYKDELSRAALDIKYIPEGLVEVLESSRKQQMDLGIVLYEVSDRLRKDESLPKL